MSLKPKFLIIETLYIDNYFTKTNMRNTGFTLCQGIEIADLLIQYGVQMKLTSQHDQSGFDYLQTKFQEKERSQLVRRVEDRISKHILMKKALIKFWKDEENCGIEIINSIVNFCSNEEFLSNALNALQEI